LSKTIIVGYGLAGFSLAVQLQENQQDFCIIDQPQWSASRTAAGLCNPTVLKRYTLAWKGNEFYSYAQTFYEHQTRQRNVFSFYEPTSIARIFPEDREKITWENAASQPALAPFLRPQTAQTLSPAVHTKHGYGVVAPLFRIHIERLLDTFKEQLGEDQFLEESFQYEALKVDEEGVEYKQIKARQIVFCEGYQMHQNPYFKYLPLVGNKGEMLMIKAPKLKIDTIIKSKLFVVPLELGYFWVGATYNWKDKTLKTTRSGRKWLEEELKKLLIVPFEIVSQTARIRPTVIDRRPLMGKHQTYQNVFVFNGLGTRGTLMAPLLSQWLYDHLFEGKPLPEKVDIKRFMAQ